MQGTGVKEMFRNSLFMSATPQSTLLPYHFNTGVSVASKSAFFPHGQSERSQRRMERQSEKKRKT